MSAWLTEVVDAELPTLARHAKDRLIDSILFSDWLRERDRMVAERAWTEGAAKARQYRDDLDLAPLNPYRVDEDTPLSPVKGADSEEAPA